jgi:hypothetical protein
MRRFLLNSTLPYKFFVIYPVPDLNNSDGNVKNMGNRLLMPLCVALYTPTCKETPSLSIEFHLFDQETRRVDTECTYAIK